MAIYENDIIAKDANGNITYRKSVNNFEENCKYDNMSNMTYYKDSEGVTILREFFDNSNKLKSERISDNNHTVWRTYDENGHLIDFRQIFEKV